MSTLSLESHLTAGHLPFDRAFANSIGKELRWHQVSAKPLSGQLNLREQMNRQAVGTNSFLYLGARFSRSEEQEMQLTTVCPGASGLVLWLNGSRLATYGESGLRLEHAAVRVRRGANELLARIQDPQCVTRFSVSLTPGRLRPTTNSAVQLPKEAYAGYALHNTGTAARGRKWFSEAAGPGCIRCHRVNGEGGITGPDLSSIGSKYNRAQLIDAVLYPSRQISPGYHQTFITTKNGETTAGLIQREDDATLTLLEESGQELAIKKSQITQRKPSKVSPMPEGLHAAWSQREFCDVIEFLESLKAPRQANSK